MTKTAFITGAAGGIGQILCARFTQEGYRVLATDKVNGSDVDCDDFIQADLRDICHSEKELDGLLSAVRDWLGDDGLTVLVNNAALQVLDPTDSVALSDWSASMDINVTAPFLLVQGLLSELETAKGSVVNIGSVHARATKPRFVSYATSKAALVGMTSALAVDLGGRVRVNAISPAAISTEMLIQGFESNREGLERLADFHPVKRIGNPEEVADLVIFLASDKAGFINGGNILVDGGILSRLHDPD